MNDGERPTVAVCAMGKRPFTAIAARWVEMLRRDGVDVVDRRAVEVRRAGALDALNGGADVVLYAGHGRERGWSGYQTIRSAHLDELSVPERPTDLVLAFACRTAAPGTDGFARSLVEMGRAAAYVGWAADVPVGSGLAIADRFVGLLASGWVGSVEQLVEQVTTASVDADELACAGGLRIIGDRDRAIGVRALDATASST